MQPILKFEGVTKNYKSGPTTIHALRETDFEAKSGELIAIVGPSGSGKSTFLSLAGALLSPTDGKIILNGQEIGQLTKKEQTQIRLTEIGFIFQAAHLVPYLRVVDQVRFIGNQAKQNKDEVTKKSVDLLNHLGLESRTTFYPKDLSGGEKQRVAIARSLINSPSIILADEPTASLDTERSREVVELLRKEVEGTKRAAIMVTHDERMLDLCDHVYRMEDGRLTKDR
ncbi:ABC transporter ATP-binding protein [Listeria fleischmannii]|uniref:ABC transporter ATP-binding protein n=1 Tax=Listeria fleischmannii TaxID=1069827 RepID=UPI0016292679|nr:ABC transporter ATP-binding protein [Listeria fleischmannii]MBC1419955.1 ABC transporter ATP-binding protein [Listeria fleischmannii]